jgi:ice-binding like protein
VRSLFVVAWLVILGCFASGALAAQAPVGLGTADSFAILAGSTVTNTGSSTINGDLGVSPGAAVTGFPPGTVNGTIHGADAVAGQAKSDLTIAYDDAAGRTPPAAFPTELGGLTLSPGAYRSGGPLGLTGTVALEAQGDPGAVFVFQSSSTLITASASHVNLVNGAQPCNVFWQVASSATLGAASVFAGNILALTSISVNNGVTLAVAPAAPSRRVRARRCAAGAQLPGDRRQGVDAHAGGEYFVEENVRLRPGAGGRSLRPRDQRSFERPAGVRRRAGPDRPARARAGWRPARDRRLARLRAPGRRRRTWLAGRIKPGVPLTIA